MAGSMAAAFLVLSSGFMLSNMSQTQAWREVFTNGSYVGLVPNNTTTISAMKRTAAGYNVNLRFSPVHKNVPLSYNWQRVTTLPEKAYAVTLNGSPLVYTHSPSTAQTVVSKVKLKLLPKDLNSNAKVQFNGHVSIKQAVIGVADILSPEAAVEYLLNPGQSPTKTSRSINILAASGANGSARIQASSFTNNGRSPKSLSASSKVSGTSAHSSKKVAKNSTKGTSQSASPHPLLTVNASEVVEKKVKVKYPVRRIKDARMGAGTVKVVKKGKPGIVSEKIRRVYKNGVLTAHKVLSKDVLSKPQTQVEDVGTNRGIATGSWIWPVPSSHIITSGYGPRYLLGRWGFHPGIDVGCPVGTPIVATNNGVVEDAGWNSGGYGIWIKLNNGHGIETVYGHLSRVKVHPGETVAKGEVIGYSGATGFVTGPHLHYEIRKYGHHINPQPYM